MIYTMYPTLSYELIWLVMKEIFAEKMKEVDQANNRIATLVLFAFNSILNKKEIDKIYIAITKFLMEFFKGSRKSTL